MDVTKLGQNISFHFVGRLRDGTVFDSSRGQPPLRITLGQGQVVPGLERALVGMEVGEKKTVEVPADEAYGIHRTDRVLEVDRAALPEDAQLEHGQKLMLTDPQGNPVRAWISGLTDDKVVLDTNHPLCDEDLIYEIELVAITPAN